MATVKIKGIKELSKRLNRNLKIQLNKLFRDKTLLKRVATIAVNDMKENNNFGSPAEKTMDWRKRYDSLNKTDRTYSRNKLSAVFTGELMQDLINNVRGDTNNKQIVIDHSNKRHKKYQGKTKKIGSRSAYSEISEGLIGKLGYDYFNLSDSAKSEITKIIRNEVFELVKNVA